MVVLKSKWFWLDIIALVLLAAQYTFANNLIPRSWLPYEGLLVVVLNAIAGMIQGQKLARTNALLKVAEQFIAQQSTSQKRG